MSFASATESPTPVAKHMDNNLVLKYENSMVACFSTETYVMVPTKTNVYVECGSKSEDNWTIQSIKNCEYEIHVKLACGGGDDDGLSGGAIFLIVIFVCFAVYMIVGAVLNKFYFKNNQIIPQQAFWCSLPGFYVAGCKYAINAVRAKISGGKAGRSDSSDSYDQV
eukprot:UN02652